jgi:hypothetical protein
MLVSFDGYISSRVRSSFVPARRSFRKVRMQPPSPHQRLCTLVQEHAGRPPSNRGVCLTGAISSVYRSKEEWTNEEVTLLPLVTQ